MKNLVTIRKSVGFSRRFGNLWQYAVLHNGKTVAWFSTAEDAERYAHDLYRRVTTKYHAR